MNFKVLCAFTAFLVLLSCTKEGPAGPQGPQGTSGTSLTGSMIGFITPYDEFGNLIDVKSGFKVTILDRTPELSALTNDLGRYQIDGLQTGTYDVSFSKTGYANSIGKSVTFIGGIAPRTLNASIVQSTATVLTNFNASLSTATNYILTGDISPATPVGKYRSIRFFLGKDNTVSTTNYTTTFRTITGSISFNTSNTYDKTKFPSGSTMYIIAVPESYQSYSFMNLTTGLYNYLNLGQTVSAVKSLVIP